MSDSVRPHRRQPTRLPRPWDSPGKNTGVGGHSLLQCMKAKGENEVTSVVSDSSRPHGLQATRLLRPWDLPGKSTGVGCHCRLLYIVIAQTLQRSSTSVAVIAKYSSFKNSKRRNISRGKLKQYICYLKIDINYL